MRKPPYSAAVYFLVNLSSTSPSLISAEVAQRRRSGPLDNAAKCAVILRNVTSTATPARPDVASPGAASFHLGYTRTLDGVRALAVLAVMTVHANLPGMRGGFFGVDAFFVLSGFLITTLLLEEWQQTGRMSLRMFYARRALRLFPALFVFLAAVTIFVTLRSTPADASATRRSAVAALLYAANWVRAIHVEDITEWLAHTWSLSIEEQFYLLWPPLLLWMLRRGVRKAHVASLLVTAVVGIGVYRAALFVAGRPWYRLYNGLDTRADCLLAGCLAGVVVAGGWLKPGSRSAAALRGAALVSLVAVLVVASQSTYMGSLLYLCGMSVASVGFAVMILAVVAAPWKPVAAILEWKPLVGIGRISYGLYLWHPPVFLALHNVPVRLRYLLLLQFAAAFACAGASFYLIERPFLRLKSRFRPNAQPAQARSASAP
jgi:peptidoglycan/LPS O-acetylase OafA/YrhL